MIKVSIAGATGFTGAELVKILSRHDGVEISHLISENNAGVEFSSIYPEMKGICDKKLSSPDYDKISEDSDAIFLCLPHSASMKIADFFYNKGKIVLDLSADYRFNNKEIYEKTYGVNHSSPDLMSNTVYGLPEVNGDLIKNAKLIAVPGCYPTSILLPLIPLIKEGLVDNDFIIADSKSGVSGAGKKATANTHFCEINENLKPYGVFNHRHKPEIDHIINRICNKHTDITFTPHLLPITRGMLSTIYSKSVYDAEKLKSELRSFYKHKPFIRLIDSIPTIKNVARTNFIDINVFSSNGKIVIISAIDNLLKGASGQAVQCFNIRMGFNETKGFM